MENCPETLFRSVHCDYRMGLVLEIEESTQQWLLEPEQPAVRYFALTTLLDRKEDDPEVREASSDLLKRGWVKDILTAQNPDGAWESVNDLYRPKYTASNWRMIVLSDLGLKHQDDPRLEKACELFFSDWLKDQDKFEEGEEVCSSGNLARFLTKFGYEDDSRVKRIFTWLVNDQKADGGWHCFESDTGTLDCWEALAAYAALPKDKRTRSIQNSIDRGAEFYLERELYKEGERYEPWFRFHYPNHYYYDLLVGLDVITSLGFAADDRLRFALQFLESKKLPNSTWALDAVHPDLAEGANYTLRDKNPNRFALEAEGKPSKWITLTALRVLKRVDEA
jgi:hypothetical protein